MTKLGRRTAVSAVLACAIAMNATAQEGQPPLTTGDDKSATLATEDAAKKDKVKAENAAEAAAEKSLKGPTDKGRRFWVRSPIHGRRIKAEIGSPNFTELACVHGGSQLVGTTQAVGEEGYQLYYVQSSIDEPGWLDGLLSPPHRRCEAVAGEALAKEGDRFLAKEGEVATAVPISAGPTWGLFAVPFKYQISEKKRLEGGAAAGAYLGYELGDQLFAFEVAPIVFFGASQIEVTQLVNGEEKKQSLFALSYGGGIKFSLSDSFDLGLVIGWDHTNDESNYEYNDKPWVAAQFGIAIDQMFK